MPFPQIVTFGLRAHAVRVKAFLWVLVGVATSLGANAWGTPLPSNPPQDAGTTANPVISGGTVSEGQYPTWREAKIVLTVDPSYSALPYARLALQAAVQAWTEAASELPEVEIVESTVPESSLTTEQNATDHRISFAPKGAAKANGALAITLLTVDASAKSISDGDIVVNGIHQFTDVTTYSTGPYGLNRDNYDLQNVLTHELGHWFGLSENHENADATMFAYVEPGETKKRDLDPEDITQVQLAYWHADNPSTHTGCSVHPGFDSPHPWSIGFLAVTLLLLKRPNRRSVPHLPAQARRHLAMTTHVSRDQAR